VVAAVVVRAGCPDHAGSVAGSVTAATLLIVGGADPVGVGRSGEVEPLLRCPSALEIIPGASPLFTEAGAMDRLVALAVDWYGRYLGAAASSPG
jgi:putative phosphoribosyl transferase